VTATGAEAVLGRLTDAGLILFRLGGGQHYTLFKPASVAGNRRPGWDSQLALPSGEVACDAPCATLEQRQGQWLFSVHEFFPDTGPGDFCHAFDQLGAAVEAVWQYYFGDPAAMNPAGLEA
jgi:hypothetical protein